MNKTGIPYLDFCFNPGGCGCSKGCDGCWVKTKVAPRVGENIGCDDCKNFRVHFHPERMGDPARRKKPAVIGVQFTGELFDRKRPEPDIFDVGVAAKKANWHTYVWLTGNPVGDGGMASARRSAVNETDTINHFWGATIRREWDLLALRKFGWMDIPGNLWLSIEPLEGRMTLNGQDCTQYGPHRIDKHGKVKGVVIGCDNRTNAEFHISLVRDLVGQCQSEGVLVYVKQIMADVCLKCGLHSYPGLVCTNCGSQTTRRLITDPKLFPPDLRIRQLPWTLTTKQP